MYPQKWIIYEFILSFFTVYILACNCVVSLNPAGDEAPHNYSLISPHPGGMGRRIQVTLVC